MRCGLALIALCALAACAGQHTAKTPVANGQTASVPQAAPLDATYDWHGLLLMPFGTLLKESPIALHEVLLFQDDSHANLEPGKDCYAVDGKPPRLMDQEPEKFLLCFSHDRLDRIEATVHLQGDDGARVFARACTLWLKGAAPQVGVDRCEGRDGDVAFSAQLGGAVGDSGGEATTAAVPGAGRSGEPSSLSVVLIHTAERGATTSAPEH